MSAVDCQSMKEPEEETEAYRGEKEDADGPCVQEIGSDTARVDSLIGNSVIQMTWRFPFEWHREAVCGRLHLDTRLWTHAMHIYHARKVSLRTIITQDIYISYFERYDAMTIQQEIDTAERTCIRLTSTIVK